MSHIKTEINKLFINPKVYLLFANSDGGQGIIDPEIDRYFSFEELEELVFILQSQQMFDFLSKYSSHDNLQQFFKRIRKRVSETWNVYSNAVDKENLLTLVKNNKDSILKKYNTLPSKEAQLTFVKAFIDKHKEIKSNTYEQVKDFFENPVSWV